MVELVATKILEGKGIEYRLIELADRSITSGDVIRHSKGELNPDEICKTIVVTDERGCNYAIFLLGDQRIDEDRARSVIGSGVSIANLNEIREPTALEPGAICPLLLTMPVIVDRNVLSRKKVNFGSGNPIIGIEMKTEDLNKVMEYRLADISSE